MSALLDRLFKPKWQHRDVQTRMKAIESLADEQVLMSLAQEDPEQAVRELALRKIQHPERLFQLCQLPALRPIAASQFTRVLLADKSLVQLNDEQKLQIAAVTEDDILREQALSSICNENILLPFIMQAGSAKTRNMAATLINQEDGLQTLMRHFKGKDKNLYRLCKDKLDLIEQQQNAAREIIQQQEKLVAQIQHLADSVFSPTFQGELLLLKQNWSKHNASEALQTRFNLALSRCEETLKQHQQEIEKLAQAQAAKNAAQLTQQNILAELNQHILQLQTDNTQNPAALQTSFELLQQNWQHSLQHHQADKHQQQQFQHCSAELTHLITALQTWQASAQKVQALLSTGETIEQQNIDKQKKFAGEIQQFVSHLNWPKKLPEPEALHTLHHLLKQLAEHVQHLKAAEKDKSKLLQHNLQTVEDLLNEGHLKDARKHMTDAFALLRDLPGEQAHKFQHEIQRLQGRVQELADWQEFAAEPKLQALCEQMEHISTQEIEIETKAERIHQLQNAWKTLASATPALSQPLWPRFKQASDLAYAPCKEYFEALAALRQQNKEARNTICAQLETYAGEYAWENADWQAVHKVLEVAHQEWQRFSPVDRKDNKPLQDRYQAITQSIRNRLQAHYDECAAAKTALINQARALLEQADIAQAIETNKQLQENWKKLGYAGKKDHSLWKQFRNQCDALFERRQQAKLQEREFTEQQIRQGEHLLSQATALLNGQTPEMDITELEIALMQLSLPEKVQHALHSKFKQIKKQLDQNALQAASQAHRVRLENAWQLHELLAKNELAGQPTAIEDNTDLDNDIRQSFIQRSQQTQTSDAHRLCLEIEILSGQSSPADDNEARMALQLTLLQSRIGLGKPDNEQRGLLLRWFSQPASGADYATYNARVKKALGL